MHFEVIYGPMEDKQDRYFRGGYLVLNDSRRQTLKKSFSKRVTVVSTDQFIHKQLTNWRNIQKGHKLSSAPVRKAGAEWLPWTLLRSFIHNLRPTCRLLSIQTFPASLYYLIKSKCDSSLWLHIILPGEKQKKKKEANLSVQLKWRLLISQFINSISCTCLWRSFHSGGVPLFGFHVLRSCQKRPNPSARWWQGSACKRGTAFRAIWVRVWWPHRYGLKGRKRGSNRRSFDWSYVTQRQCTSVYQDFRWTLESRVEVFDRIVSQAAGLQTHTNKS